MSRVLSSTALFQIDCFVRVVEAGSYAEAARRAGTTTSAVSKAISRFEREHGLQLLHRSTHSLSLTAEGEALLDEARNAACGLERLEALLSRTGERGEEGRVRISAPPGFARACLLPALPALRRRHPGIRLDVRANYRTVDLAEEGVDLAIRGGSLGGVPGHYGRRLFSFAWRVYAAPDYLACRGTPLTIADLSAHDLVGFRGNGRVAPWRLRDPATGSDAATLLREADAAIVFDDGPTAYDFARRGCGIVWAPEWLARDDLRDGRIVELLEAWRPPGEVEMHVLSRTARAPRRTGLVLEFLRECGKAWDSNKPHAGG